jgi:hypothetical protein
MRIGRTIAALLVALSVAMLPFASGASVPSSIDILASGSMPDGCDHGAPDDASKAGDDCASMAACAAKCFNYAGTTASDATVAPIGSNLRPVGDSGLVVSQTRAPPFRPPRV